MTRDIKSCVERGVRVEDQMGAASREHAGNDVGKQAGFRAHTGEKLTCQVIKLKPHLPGPSASQGLSTSSLGEEKPNAKLLGRQAMTWSLCDLLSLKTATVTLSL